MCVCVYIYIKEVATVIAATATRGFPAVYMMQGNGEEEKKDEKRVEEIRVLLSFLSFFFTEKTVIKHHFSKPNKQLEVANGSGRVKTCWPCMWFHDLDLNPHPTRFENGSGFPNPHPMPVYSG